MAAAPASVSLLALLSLLLLAVASGTSLSFQPRKAFHRPLLYPCDIDKFNDELLQAAKVFEDCVRSASSSSSSSSSDEKEVSLPPQCLSVGIVSAGSVCVCFACGDSFSSLSAVFGRYVKEGLCGDLLEYYNVSSFALKVLQDYPCLLDEPHQQRHVTSREERAAVDLPATLCPDPDSQLCGLITQSRLATAGVPRASGQAQSLCGQALQVVCSPDTAVNGNNNEFNVNPPPFCGLWCDSATGVCDTVSNGTELTAFQSSQQPTIPLSLFDFMCAPTGPYAQSVVASFAGTSSTYWVNLTTANIFTNNTIQLLPTYSAYYVPPVLLQGNPGMYDLVKCLPGINCYQSGVYYCLGGYYCPNPFENGMIPCPKGTFCPRGSVFPFDCGFLDDCPYATTTRRQYIGALVAGIVLGVGILVFGIIKLIEVMCMRQWRQRLAREGLDNAGEKGQSNDGKEKEALRLELPPVPAVDIAFTDIRVKVKGGVGGRGRLIINDAGGSFPAGSLTAILGGSGAGKTTLMDSLLGTVPLSGGRILINDQSGMTLGDCPAGMVGYVPQQDILFHALTVREVLEHAAAVRLPGSWSRSQRKRQVDAVIATLGLQQCEHLVIGHESEGGSNSQSISGGQRKRVSIGIELVANPSVLILDECTTGLDATSALELMECLQRVAREGRTVIAILHQPRYEIFERTLDRVLLLARGRVVYEGPSDKAVSYFESLGYEPPPGNPAEFLLDLLSGDSAAIELLAAKRKERGGEKAREEEGEIETPRPRRSRVEEAEVGGANIFAQTWAATYRHWLQRYRSPSGMVVFALVHMFIGAVLGVGFLKSDHGIFVPPVPTDIANLCPPPLTTLCRTEPIDWMSLRLSSFYLSLALGTAALVSAVFTFGSEMEVLRREIGAGGWRARLALFVGKNIAEIPFMLVGPLFFSAVYVPMLRPDSAWILQYCIFVGVEVACYGLGYMLSMLFPLGSAHVVGVVIVFGFSVCSGTAPSLRTVREQLGPLRALWDISFPRYAVEASIAVEAEYFLKPGQAFDESTRLFADHYGFSLGMDAFWKDIVVMICIGLGFRVLAGLLFWYHTRGSGGRGGGMVRTGLKRVGLWPLALAVLTFFGSPVQALTNNGVCNLCGTALFAICDCPVGFYCSDATRPFCERCPSGYYCPVTGDVPPLPCPDGSWCPSNIYIPLSCDSGAFCTAERMFYLLGPSLALGAVLLFFILHCWQRGYLSYCYRRLVSLRHPNYPAEKEDTEVIPLLSEAATEEGAPLEERDRQKVVRFDIQLEEVSVKRGRMLSIPLPFFSFGAQTVLSHVSGHFGSGRLIAIMGPSGSGKTTLLNVLRGSLPVASGTVRVNGEVCRRGLREYRDIMGMVPQDDDTVDPLFTVEEALLHSARLRLPSRMWDKERRQIARDTLSVLALTAVRHQLVGTGLAGTSTRGVSGGQRKRTNIGVELVTQPSILLLDEPTSGLDSHVAASVIGELKAISKEQGVTVIATIHQPSQAVFQQFDTLVLLVGGRVAYWGPPSDAVRYLESALGIEMPPKTADPDFVLDVASTDKDRKQSLADAWESSARSRSKSLNDEAPHQSGNDDDTEPNFDLGRLLHLRSNKRSAPWPHMQLFVQVWRQVIRTLRTVLNSLLLLCVIFGCTGGYLALAFTDPKYVLPVPSKITEWCPRAVNDLTSGQKWVQPCNPDWPSAEVQGLAAMYFCMALGTLSAALSVWTFGGDSAIYRREKASGVNTVTYFLAANILDGAKCALYALFFVSAYFLIAAPYGSFADYYLLCYCFILTNYGLGYLISTLLRPANAAIVATLGALVAGVASGFVFQYVPVWPWYFGEGLFRTEAQYVVEHARDTQLNSVRHYADRLYGYHIEDDTVRNDELLMLAYAGGFRVAAYILLRLLY